MLDRRTGIGGSDAWRVIYEPWKLWLEKTGQTAPIVESEPMYWGTRLEAVVADHYAREHATKLRRSRLLRHREHRFLYAHPDRLIDPDGGLEVKTRSAYAREDWGPSGSDQIEVRTYLQVLHYLAVTGRSWWDVAVLLGGSEYREYRVLRDEAAIRDLVETEVAWWRRHIIEGEPPDPDASDEAKAYFEKRRTEAPVEVVEVTTELAEAARNYLAAKTAQAKAEEAAKYWANVIRAKLDGAQRARGSGYAITWTERAGARRLDAAKLIELAKIDPALVEAATVVGSPTYVLTVKEVADADE